jgi:hypothetical protein
MSYIKRQSVTLATNAGGDATGFIEGVNGVIESIEYTKVDYDNGVDFTITNNRTSEQIWAENDVNASAVRRPRAATHSNAGVAALYAAGGTAVLDKIAVSDDKIKIVVAQGGNVKSGTITVVYS